jgi:uncharacterized protein YprB with RNaseH-like and TPR domain
LVATPKIGVMYLNIETTDDPGKVDVEVSNIVWWCNNKWFSWVKGKNDPDEFLLFWKYAPRVVTFKGRASDEPLLCRQFNIRPHKNHIELHKEAKKQGMSGGLKALGEVFGFPRTVGLEKVDADIAIRLWKEYEKDGSFEALDNLLYCSAWNVVLSYYLHCFFSKTKPDTMQNTIPFTFNLYHMKSIDMQTGQTSCKTTHVKKTAGPKKKVIKFKKLDTGV